VEENKFASTWTELGDRCIYVMYDIPTVRTMYTNASFGVIRSRDIVMTLSIIALCLEKTLIEQSEGGGDSSPTEIRTWRNARTKYDAIHSVTQPSSSGPRKQQSI